MAHLHGHTDCNSKLGSLLYKIGTIATLGTDSTGDFGSFPLQETTTIRLTTKPVSLVVEEGRFIFFPLYNSFKVQDLMWRSNHESAEELG